MEEWRDPLCAVRCRLAALLFLCIPVLPSISHAEIRHSVFGLNPGLTYDVYVDGCAVMVGVRPSPAGDLTFVGAASDPVRVVPNSTPHTAGAPSSSTAHGLGVSPPAPNPTRGPFELRIGADRAKEIRISLIEAGAGRSRYSARYVILAGENRIRLAVPEHLASGLYLVRVEDGSNAVVRKLLLLRDGEGALKR